MEFAVQDLDRRVIVVTGGSSGIGLATVDHLLDAGSTVVAVARGGDALEQVAAARSSRPGVLEVAALDVTDAAAVDGFVADLVARHGKVDGWVNAAGITTYGRFETLPAEEFDRVVAVNLLGSANGARAVLPRFRDQGEGVLVNIASVLGRFGTPLMSPYVASKFAVRGWSQSLRMEVRDAPGVSVCAVLPGPVDTPLFQHAGNRTGERIESPSLPMDPDRVAEAIVGLLRRPRREVVVGQASRLLFLAFAVAPGVAERVLGPAMAWDHTAGGAQAPTAGALDRSGGEGQPVGGWRLVPLPHVRRLIRGAGALAGGAILSGVAAAAERRRR